MGTKKVVTKTDGLITRTIALRKLQNELRGHHEAEDREVDPVLSWYTLAHRRDGAIH